MGKKAHEFQTSDGSSSWIPWTLSFVLLSLIHFLVIPWLQPYWTSILIYAGINIILTVSLNLVNGFTGQFSMGHAGFMAVGGYLSAFLSISLRKHYPEYWLENWFQEGAFLFSLLAGGFAASLVGYAVGLPSLRLKGDYLAIVTLGFGEIIRVILLNLEVIGGARGLPNIPLMSSFIWIGFFVLSTIFVIWRLIHSAYGRAFLAVREDEIAAESLGLNTTLVKIRAFTIGAFFAGIAGGLFSHYLCYLNPQTFDLNRSFEIIIMVVLGGMGSLSGSVVAAIFLTFTREALRPLQELTRVDFRMIIYSLLLIGLMLSKPNGLLGKRELWSFWLQWRRGKK